MDICRPIRAHRRPTLQEPNTLASASFAVIAHSCKRQLLATGGTKPALTLSFLGALATRVDPIHRVGHVPGSSHRTARCDIRRTSAGAESVLF